MDLEFFNKYDCLIGCDEVGRGPIAGPVNACAVFIERDHKEIISHLSELGVTDSKKLTQKKRLLILEKLGINIASLKVGVIYNLEFLGFEFKFILSELSPLEIDKINILQASLECMKRSAENLIKSNTLVLIDGNKTFNSTKAELMSVVKGDSKSVVIGLASIIAKEYRDELMVKLDKVYPGYGLAKHAGYPTKIHKEAVKNLGVTDIHRKSFKGVKEFL